MEVPSPPKKQRFADVKSGNVVEEKLCPPSKKRKGRKIMKVKRAQKQMKAAPVLLYIVFGALIDYYYTS